MPPLSRLRSLSLASLVGLAMLVPASHAQESVLDSVRMDLSIVTFRNDYMAGDTPRTACGAAVVATWPNVTTQLYAREGRYSDYNLRATEGMYVPYGYGEMPDPPANRLGHLPQLGGSGDGPSPVDCGQFYARAAYRMNGGTGPLNGRPFRVTEWYAVFTILDGTPLALFEWEPAGGLAVAFDGSFESGFSHEVDVTMPDNKRPVASYLWRFGDGNTGSGATPTHTYTEPGEYTVRLIVTDDDGEESFHEETVTVHAAHLTVQIESATEEGTKGDTLDVRATITNSGSETVYGVRADRFITHLTRVPDDLAHPSGQIGDLSLEPAALADGEENHVYQASLAPGESIEVTRRYVVKNTATYRIFAETSFEPAEMYVSWVGIEGVEGETAEIDQVEVRQPCTAKEARCASTLIYPPVRNVALMLRTRDSDASSSATVGITHNPATDWAGFLNIDTGRGGIEADAITCQSGCVELIATVTGRNDEPIEGAEVRFTASTLTGDSVATAPPRGAFMCEKGRNDRFVGGNCASGPGDFQITAETASDGQARAILSLQSVLKPMATTVKVESYYENNVMDEDTAPLTVEPNVIFESEQTLTAYDAGFVFAQRQLVVFGGTANSIGDFCENVVKSLKKDVASQNASAAQQNVAVFGIHVGTSWVCDGFLKKVSNITAQGQKILDWLTGEGKVGATGDALKKLGGANLYLWTLNAYDVKNPHGLSLASGPHPPPAVVYFDGDFFEWTTEAMKKLIGEVTYDSDGQPVHRDLTGVRTRLRITDLSTRKQEATPGVISTNFLRGRAELAEWKNGDWQVVHSGDLEYLYLPHLFVGESTSEWLAIKLGIVDQDPDTGDLTVSVSDNTSGRSASRQAPPDYVAGDIVLIGEGESEELNQVVSMDGTTVELVLPLASDHAPGAPVAFFAKGTAGPPPPPLLVMNLDPEANVELAWMPHSETLVASYDIQIAADEAMSSLILDETTTFTSAPISPGAFTDGQVYYWRVRSVNRLGASEWSDVFPFTAGETVITPNEAIPEDALPAALSLSVYPNPAVERVMVTVNTPAAGPVRITLYDALGRQVGVLDDRDRPAGRHELAVQVSGLPAGMYVARIENEDTAATQRFTVVR